MLRLFAYWFYPNSKKCYYHVHARSQKFTTGGFIGAQYAGDLFLVRTLFFRHHPFKTKYVLDNTAACKT